MEFFFAAGAGVFGGGVFEFAAALAGGQLDAAVAGGFEVGGAGGVGGADGGVVGRLEARDEGAGVVGLALVVVVAVKGGGLAWVGSFFVGRKG